MLTKGVWTPVHAYDMTRDEQTSIIRSSMFVREKYLANGDYDKLKARLVAGGHMQDKTITLVVFVFNFFTPYFSLT